MLCYAIISLLFLIAGSRNFFGGTPGFLGDVGLDLSILFEEIK